ncbi:cytoplasmic tRNA 2-thiolation protein 2 [Ascosphaera aggregata]|nr:cytoplasmic tRNA 2-thiolation protein 2 [Ascosphaera aggregata]
MSSFSPSSLAELCMDCKSVPPTLTLRKRELCENCALRFISGKVLRRMERYKLRNAPKTHRRRLLLPLSFGVGSLTLLHILDGHLRKYAVGGAKVTPFDLIVLSVEPGSIDGCGGDGSEQERRMEAVRKAYPWINEYRCVKLEDMFDTDKDISSVLQSHGWIEKDDDKIKSNRHRLDAFRLRLSTPTTRRDIDHVLLTRLITSFAQREQCEGIFWGHCDTTLAARALANVSKGRGFSLTYEINDGICPGTGLYYNFPLRDLFRSEVDIYASIALKEIDEVIIKNEGRREMSNRHMSIEELLEHYVDSQAEKYPGVMANIVRTIAKLEVGNGPTERRCRLCGMPLPESVGEGNDLCYGCARSAEDIKS